MRDDIQQALAIDGSSGPRERTIDVTTTGRRSGEPRRIETWFYRFEGTVYLSGRPGHRPRRWLLNLEAEPHFVFHLKHDVVADLPAVGEVITDPDERRRVLPAFHADFRRRNPAEDGPGADLEDWLAASPLVEVRFDDA